MVMRVFVSVSCSIPETGQLNGRRCESLAGDVPAHQQKRMLFLPGPANGTREYCCVVVFELTRPGIVSTISLIQRPWSREGSIHAGRTMRMRSARLSCATIQHACPHLNSEQRIVMNCVGVRLSSMEPDSLIIVVEASPRPVRCSPSPLLAAA